MGWVFMWRPDAKCCGHEIVRIQELATPVLVGWLLIQTEIGYRVIHKNGLQTDWHDDADSAVIEAYDMQKQYMAIRKKNSGVVGFFRYF